MNKIGNYIFMEGLTRNEIQKPKLKEKLGRQVKLKRNLRGMYM